MTARLAVSHRHRHKETIVFLVHVKRLGENEISFPGCKEFPYKLIRCQGG